MTNAKDVVKELIEWLGEEGARIEALRQNYRLDGDNSGSIYCTGNLDAHHATVQKLKELLDTDETA